MVMEEAREGAVSLASSWPIPKFRADFPYFGLKMGLAHFRWKSSSVRECMALVRAQKRHAFLSKQAASTESVHDPQNPPAYFANLHPRAPAAIKW
jgi:hypothetical protein